MENEEMIKRLIKAICLNMSMIFAVIIAKLSSANIAMILCTILTIAEFFISIIFDNEPEDY